MNEQTRYYKLKFISGELAGRVFALDNFVLIGRSRDAHIRPGASDIAPEHVSLAVEEDGSVMMHVFSDALTAVNNFELAGDTDLNLPVNSDVRLGKELVFVLEESEAVIIPALPETRKEDEEELPTEDITENISEEKSSETPSESENEAAPPLPSQPDTAENVTRYASEAELQALRKINRNVKLKRKALLVFGGIISSAIIAGAYLYSNFRNETILSWPGLADNKVNDSEFYVDMGKGAKCMIYYPNAPWMKVNKEKYFCEVMTAIGRNLDVPFHLVLKVSDLKNGFFLSSEKSFTLWHKEMAEEKGFSFQGEKERTFFRPTGHGFPAYKQKYLRTFGKLRWQGLAIYMRWQDKEIVLLKEVPMNHYRRASELLDSFDCFVVSGAWSNTHWEVPEKFFPGKSSTLLLRAHNELAKDMDFISWRDLSLILRTLLSSSAAAKDRKVYDSALPLWLEFRERQNIWYSQQCLAYIAYRNAGNQEGMRKIVNSCLRHFNTPDDHRHMRILKNIWEITND